MNTTLMMRLNHDNDSWDKRKDSARQLETGSMQYMPIHRVKCMGWSELFMQS